MAADEDHELSGVSEAEREWMAAVRDAASLELLLEFTDADGVHEAYFDTRDEWRRIQQKRLDQMPITDGLPGDSVRIGNQEFRVHGITHADTDAERRFLHRHVTDFIDTGNDVYCEQGIRPMYFDEFPTVCEIDDYQWAMARSRAEDINSHVEERLESEFDDLSENVSSLISQFRKMTFSLIKSGSDLYGDRFAQALGDVASDFLLSHEEIGTGEDFRSFKKSREAARNPEKLVDLQRYYTSVFLPQPLEREWLRRHDPEIELFTHARNERIAEYAVYHADAPTVNLIVGAAHQPGVIYYLEEYRDGKRDPTQFEVVN